MDPFEKYPAAIGLIMGQLGEYLGLMPIMSRMQREQGVPGIQGVLEGIQACREAMAELGYTGDPVSLWGDWKLQEQLERDPEFRERMEAANA